MNFMIARLSLLLALLCCAPALAQQNVRVPVDHAGTNLDLAAQLFRPAGNGRFAAVALFHGCGGPGQNTARMAGLLRDWGYVALVVDSFSARGLTDVCGRNWPTQADAESAPPTSTPPCTWLGEQGFVDPERLAFMGYSYGGGVAMLRALVAAPRRRRADRARGDPGLSRLRAGRCAGPEARRAPADPVRHGRARRLDAGVAMPGRDRPGREGPRPRSRPASTRAPITASTRSACRCAISRASATAASPAAAAARTTAPTRRRGKRS